MHQQKSTSVRTIYNPAEVSPVPRARPPSGPAALRATMGGLDRLVPGVPARVADHLWFRLPAVPSASTRERHTVPGGRAFVTRRHGMEVRGRIYGPEDAPTAHLVHGWGGWWQQLAAHIPGLLSAGYRVVVHDAPSHGGSPAGRHGPRSSTIMEIAEAFEVVAWQQGPPDLVVAHSVGAAAVGWAFRKGTAATAYVFLAPAVSVWPMLDWFEQVAGIGPRARPRLVARVERRVGHPLSAFEVTSLFRQAAAAEPRPALLTIHDRGDSDTPAQGSVDLARAWPGGRLVLTEGLGHRRVIWHPEVVERVAGFARSHAAAHR